MANHGYIIMSEDRKVFKAMLEQHLSPSVPQALIATK